MSDNHLSLSHSTKEERARELEQEFSFDGYQVVRRELFAHQRDPAVVIRRDSIAFNAACIQGLEDTVYILVLINPDTRRMVIKKCAEDDKNALRWCVARPEKRISRKVSSKQFSTMLYKLLDWDEDCRYKILGYRISVDGELVYIFDLLEPEVFYDRRKQAAKESPAVSMTEPSEGKTEHTAEGAVTEDTLSGFGVPLEDNQQALQVSLDEYQASDTPLKKQEGDYAGSSP